MVRQANVARVTRLEPFYVSDDKHEHLSTAAGQRDAQSSLLLQLPGLRVHGCDLCAHSVQQSVSSFQASCRTVSPLTAAVDLCDLCLPHMSQDLCTGDLLEIVDHNDLSKHFV